MKVLKYIIEAFIIYTIFLLIKIIGIKWGRIISSYIFLKLGSVFRSKKIINENISIAFNNISETRKDDIIKSMWKNYGYVFSEYIFMKNFRFNKFSKPHISIQGKEGLNEVVNSGRPAIFVSGHFANFELMAMELEKNNINLSAIYRPLNNFLINLLWFQLEKNIFVKTKSKKD